jgi:hypothetical protein
MSNWHLVLGKKTKELFTAMDAKDAKEANDSNQKRYHRGHKETQSKSRTFEPRICANEHE